MEKSQMLVWVSQHLLSVGPQLQPSSLFRLSLGTGIFEKDNYIQLAYKHRCSLRNSMQYLGGLGWDCLLYIRTQVSKLHISSMMWRALCSFDTFDFDTFAFDYNKHAFYISCWMWTALQLTGFTHNYRSPLYPQVSISKDRMVQIASRLKQAVNLFKRRMDWLTSESRRIFGVITESVIIIILGVTSTD